MHVRIFAALGFLRPHCIDTGMGPDCLSHGLELVSRDQIEARHRPHEKGSVGAPAEDERVLLSVYGVIIRTARN